MEVARRETTSNISLLHAKLGNYERARKFGANTIDLDPSWFKVTFSNVLKYFVSDIDAHYIVLVLIISFFAVC